MTVIYIDYFTYLQALMSTKRTALLKNAACCDGNLREEVAMRFFYSVYVEKRHFRSFKTTITHVAFIM